MKYFSIAFRWEKRMQATVTGKYFLEERFANFISEVFDLHPEYELPSSTRFGQFRKFGKNLSRGTIHTARNLVIQVVATRCQILRLIFEVKAKGQWPLTCNTNHNTMFDMQAVNI